jgi:hypothetical protein
MVFSNGWMISIRFGEFANCSPGFYCPSDAALGSKSDKDFFLEFGGEGVFGCYNAEVAIFNPEGNYVRPDGFDFSEDMKGFVKPDEVSLLIGWVSSRQRVST